MAAVAGVPMKLPGLRLRFAAGRRSGRIAAVLAILACVVATAAWADPPGRVGRLSWLAGEVSLRTSDEALASPAQRNWPIRSGDVLSTGPTGRAELWIGSSSLRLDVASEVQVEQLDDTTLRLRLDRGSLALRSATPEAARGASVETALGRFAPLEPGQFRVDAPGPQLGASAWRGALRFEGGGSSLTLNPGQRAALTAVPGGVNFSLVATAADDFQAFVLNRDASYDGRIASRYVSPEMTGIEDLDGYGRWQQTDEYGAIWLPAVGVDWAPYRYGHWAWLEPWGWTWVDAAAWGFAPFHYGRWALWGGHWGWVPGAYVARPVYAPALVVWAGAAGGPLGWFPLAPHEAYAPPYAASVTYVRELNLSHVPNLAGSGSAPPRYAFQGDVRAATVVRSPAVLASRQPVASDLMAAGDPRARALLAAPAGGTAPAPPLARERPMSPEPKAVAPAPQPATPAVVRGPSPAPREELPAHAPRATRQAAAPAADAPHRRPPVEPVPDATHPAWREHEPRSDEGHGREHRE